MQKNNQWSSYTRFSKITLRKILWWHEMHLSVRFCQCNKLSKKPDSMACACNPRSAIVRPLWTVVTVVVSNWSAHYRESITYTSVYVQGTCELPFQRFGTFTTLSLWWFWSGQSWNVLVLNISFSLSPWKWSGFF